MKRIWNNKTVVKPCSQLHFCPYGQMVDDYPESEKFTEFSCTSCGNDCPVYYIAESFMDVSKKINDVEIKNRLVRMHTQTSKKGYIRCNQMQ